MDPTLTLNLAAPGFLSETEAQRMRLLFEPIVAVVEESMARYEVTPRLARDDGEVLAPAQLAPLMSGVEDAQELDQWLLDTGLDALQHAYQTGRPVQLFLHQSFASACRNDWLERVRDGINRRGLFRLRPVLQFQIQELIGDPQRAAAVARRLARLGIHLCLNGLEDDPAAWEALGRIPATYTRLSRATVQTQSLRNLRALIERAQAYGLRVIATGVDNAEIISRLCSAGADLFQGAFVQSPSQAMNYDFGDPNELGLR